MVSLTYHPQDFTAAFLLWKRTLCHLGRLVRWGPPPCGCRWTDLQSLWLLLSPNWPWWNQTPPEKRQKWSKRRAGRKRGKEGDREVKAVRSDGVTNSTGKHLSFTSAFSPTPPPPPPPPLHLTHSHTIALLPIEETLQLPHCGDSFVFRACAYTYTRIKANTV